MKISVVTVCLNSEATIAHTVRSFLAQTHPDKEMVVVDGRSRDGTLGIVRSLASSDIRVISEKDRGLYDAMNKGLALYAGEAVGFLNSDDAFHDPGALARIASGLERAEAVHGGLLMVTDHASKRPVRSWDGEPFRRGAFRWGWMPPHPTFYVRRALAERTGPFNLDYRIAADYDYMLRALELHAASAAFVPGILVDFMVGGTSTKGIAAVIKANLECARSRRAHLRTGWFDPALILKPARKLQQQHWRLPATG